MAKNDKTITSPTPEELMIQDRAVKAAKEGLERGDLRPMTLPPVSSDTLGLGPDPSQSVSSEIGDADKRADVLDLVAKWAPDMEVVHVGGALPPMFPEEPRVGDCRVCRFIGHDIIPAEKSKLDNDFVSLNFQVLNPLNGNPMGTASMPLGAVLFDFFKVEVIERQDMDGRKKTVRTFVVHKEPSNEILFISYGGKMPSKKGEPANRWIIERLQDRKATVQGKKVS